MDIFDRTIQKCGLLLEADEENSSQTVEGLGEDLSVVLDELFEGLDSSERFNKIFPLVGDIEELALDYSISLDDNTKEVYRSLITKMTRGLDSFESAVMNLRELHSETIER